MRDAILTALAIGAGGAAAAGLVLGQPRRRAAALGLALALAATAITIEAWNDARFQDLRDSPLALSGAAAVGMTLVAGLVVLLRRMPSAFPILAVAALPFRIPIEAGGGSANLLLPLYVVIAAGVVAAAIDAFREPAPAPAQGSREESAASGLTDLAAVWLPRVLAASVLIYALQAGYSRDLPQALENLCFFYVPFATLFALLLTVRWSRPLLVATFVVLVAEALLFAIVGFIEYAVRDLLWNPRVEAANLFHPYFRVNSLFWDPNILARYLAISAAAATALMLWTRSTRIALGSAAAALLMLATIGITFSQSGLLALLAALGTLAALRWSARLTLTIAGLSAAAAVILLLVGPGDQSSGRGELIEGGLELAEERPIGGWGSGSFSKRFTARFGAGEEGPPVSHTEPITIAAEQGAIGLIVYVVLIATALATLLARLASFAPGLRASGAGSRDPPLREPDAIAFAAARVAVVAGFVGMLVHSLSYAAFLTDPITWTLLAIGLPLVRAPLPAEASEPRRERAVVAPAGA
jgi:putative inorganic carbon (hco3(-)) transporter